MRRGHRLRFPHSSAIKGLRHGRLRELCVPGRPPIRVFYAFDPSRTAILLIAGHKTDSERFYRDYVPRADAIYDEYLREIEDERRRAGRPEAMSGHHPWSELTRHFTPEDREIVEAGAAEIVADSDRREREAERPARPARVSPQGGATARPAPDPAALRPDG